ncbi:MAG TPA: SgcJ/EcaC family oxidoreductase [Propionicimonas sp.]|nr:SgcJ/EcaC family oxidoreductase [Propionicimonas sp.]HQA78221.1 SgcJ/EcaC family oxidoreductase [Propionicimonas sp.]
MSPKSSVSFKKLRQLATSAVRLPLPAGGSPVREPLEVVRRFTKAWNRHDADGIAELFTDDVDFVNVVGLWWTSPRSIRRAHKRGFERMFGATELVVEKLKLRWLGEDAALVHARWRMTGQVDPEGQPAQARRGIASVVVQRLADDSWIAVSWQNTDIAPSADTNLNVAGKLAPSSYLERPPADPEPAEDPS